MVLQQKKSPCIQKIYMITTKMSQICIKKSNITRKCLNSLFCSLYIKEITPIISSKTADYYNKNPYLRKKAKWPSNN
jgi:hypothetical protein